MGLQRTVTAMAKVGIPPEQRDSVFATVAAVLHLGNVSFVEGKESDSSTVAPGSAQEHLQAAGEARKQLAGQQRYLRGITQRQPCMQLFFQVVDQAHIRQTGHCAAYAVI